MRKRRRLANKMTIMVCAVLIAVSAFFYAPMEVSAEEIVSTDSGFINCPTTGVNSYSFDRWADDSLSLLGFDDNSYYSLNFHLYGDFEFNHPVWFSDFFIRLDNSQLTYIPWDTGGAGEKTFFYFDETFSVILKGSEINGSSKKLNYNARVVNGWNPISDLTCDFNLSLEVVSYSILASTDAESYQNGYNAGYADGESAGYGNGYSNGFTDGEASVDTDAIYDEAFQAGKESVDTQSYYDAGYQAGYQVAYSEGYENGYDVGYQSAIDRIANWGADTSEYPILVYNKNLSDVSCDMEVVTNMPSVGHGQVNLCNLDININPSHTYKIVFDSVYPSVSVGDLAGSMAEQFNYNIGLFSIPWSVGESFCFVQGSSLSSVFRLEVYDYSAHYYEIGGENDVFQPWEGYRTYKFETIDVSVYDMGPSGDTQNHIANQTDQLTNGYDDSKGNTVNSELSTGLNDYETAENSLFATATTGMKDFTFFDFESVPAMLTAVTFITSIMGSWFEQAGGASGVGIVLSILFSVMLVSMVLGLYRLYQSAGHRAEARERHRERMEQWKRGK